jgi:glyoxylase-like metal-dependent hydrolase (beta-lactamase superfamily II)
LNYTGTVVTGGETAVRRLPDAVVRKANVSAQDNNSYLVTCRATGREILIDAADRAPRLLELLAESAADSGQGLDLVVTTHQHWDHHRALADILTATGASSASGRADAEALPIPPNRLIDHGDIVTIGELRFDVVHLRGHTPGSIALVLRSTDGSTHAFTGDSLFPGGVGNTFGNVEHFRSLIDDVEQRLFGLLPDDTWVYPGHGKDTTLSAERPLSPMRPGLLGRVCSTIPTIALRSLSALGLRRGGMIMVQKIRPGVVHLDNADLADEERAEGIADIETARGRENPHQPLGGRPPLDPAARPEHSPRGSTPSRLTERQLNAVAPPGRRTDVIAGPPLFQNI